MAEPPIDFRLLAQSGVSTRSFNAGEVIFREGDPAEELYVVQSGLVRIKTGKQVLETLGPNSIFGEMALIDAQPRSATAVAVTDATVAPIREEQFLSLIRETPYFALWRPNE